MNWQLCGTEQPGFDSVNQKVHQEVHLFKGGPLAA